MPSLRRTVFFSSFSLVRHSFDTHRSTAVAHLNTFGLRRTTRTTVVAMAIEITKVWRWWGCFVNENSVTVCERHAVFKWLKVMSMLALRNIHSMLFGLPTSPTAAHCRRRLSPAFFFCSLSRASRWSGNHFFFFCAVSSFSRHSHRCSSQLTFKFMTKGIYLLAKLNHDILCVAKWAKCLCA